MWQTGQLAAAVSTSTDVLVLTLNVRFLSLLPALLLARVFGIRTVLWGHGVSKSDTRPRLMLRAVVVRLADAAIFYDTKSIDVFRSLGISPRKLFAAPNALDTTAATREYGRYRADPALREKVRRRLHLESGPVILFVARIEPRRRLDLLLQAISILVKEFPNLTLLVVGEGETRELKALANKLALESVIHWKGAVYDEVELGALFCSADVFCLPSHAGLSILHACAYGLPVVTSDDPDVHGPEFSALRHGENAMLYRNRDIKALTDTLETLLRDAVLRERIGAAARRTATEEVNLEVMVSSFVHAMRATVVTPSSGRAF